MAVYVVVVVPLTVIEVVTSVVPSGSWVVVVVAVVPGGSGDVLVGPDAPVVVVVVGGAGQTLLGHGQLFP